jgi:hypothetical protein
MPVITLDSVFFLITVFPDFTGMPVAEFQERKSRNFAYSVFFPEKHIFEG